MERDVCLRAPVRDVLPFVRRGQRPVGPSGASGVTGQETPPAIEWMSEIIEFVCEHEGCGAKDRRRQNQRGPAARVCDACLERSKKLRSNPSHIWPTHCGECNRRRALRSGPSGGNSSKRDPSEDLRANAVAPDAVAEDPYGVFRFGQRARDPDRRVEWPVEPAESLEETLPKVLFDDTKQPQLSKEEQQLLNNLRRNRGDE